MENKDKLNQNYIKNCTCYYFDDIIRFWNRDIDFSDILLDETLYKENYENILIYDISCKTSTGAKPLRVRFDKIDDLLKFMIKLDIQYYLIIVIVIKFVIRSNILCLIKEKSGIADSINHNFGRIRIDSYDSLPIERILTFHDAIILIKLVVNKNKNQYYYIFRKRFV